MPRHEEARSGAQGPLDVWSSPGEAVVGRDWRDDAGAVSVLRATQRPLRRGMIVH